MLMRANPFHCLPSFLALLLGVVHGSNVPLSECNAQAWVRAPDLAPNTIVQGDVRIKLSAGCPIVESALVGLRFKERFFVKTKHSGEVTHHLRTHPMISVEKWVFREEEQVMFETTQVVDMGEGQHEAAHDVVQPFAILVPSTNFPPALDYDNFVFVTRIKGSIRAESMYEYFVSVAFVNGTTKEISAGFTAFRPLYDLTNVPETPKSQTIELETKGLLKESLPEHSPVAKYTAEVSAVNGLTFTQGSRDQDINIIITRTGPARTFTEPLQVGVCLDACFSPKGAIMSDSLIENPRYVLRATPEDQKHKECTTHWPNHSSCFLGARGASITMGNATLDQIQASDIVTTTSIAVNIPIQVDRRQLTNFESYYQTFSSSLRIILEIPHPHNEDIDPDDPSDLRVVQGPIRKYPQFDDNEEEWVPWLRKPDEKPTKRLVRRTYTGDAPVVILPADDTMREGHCLSATTGAFSPKQVVMSDGVDCHLAPLHYLADGAQAPTFVDGNAIQELQGTAPTHRNLLAPPLEPVVESSTEGEGLMRSYYRVTDGTRRLIYVGETWLRRVAHSDEEWCKVTATRPANNMRTMKRWSHLW